MIKNRSMHIAIKKLETSSPNEQTWSNTFHGTLGVRCKEYPIPNTPQVAPSPQLQPSFLVTQRIPNLKHSTGGTFS